MSVIDDVRREAVRGGTAESIARRLGADPVLVKLALGRIGADAMALNGSCGPACAPGSRKACVGCPLASQSATRAR